MRKTLMIFIILLTISALGVSYMNDQRVIVAKLIKITEKDTISFKQIETDDKQIIDLKFCLENFKYPPKLSKDIYWIRPDTTGNAIPEKENIKFKYEFDQYGRVTWYYYQGSYISGIFPLPYLFKYDSKQTDKITEIIDGFYKIQYHIDYDKNYNIKFIEKRDSLNQIIEILMIDIK